MHILAISPGRDVDFSKWEDVAHSGIDALMIREKYLDGRPLLELGRQIKKTAPDLPLWVNGRLDVALALGAGFHGGEDYPQVPVSLCPVSKPLHNLSQLQELLTSAQLLISPVFAVSAKGKPLGTHGLHELLDKMPPWDGKLLALGGVNPDNVAGLQHARLDGIALIRGLWDSERPYDIVNRLRSAWKENKC